MFEGAISTLPQFGVIHLQGFLLSGKTNHQLEVTCKIRASLTG